MRIRKFSKYGNTDVIKLKPHDKKDMGLEYGDEVDVDKIKKIKSTTPIVQKANNYDNKENWSKKCDEVNERRLDRALEREE